MKLISLKMLGACGAAALVWASQADAQTAKPKAAPAAARPAPAAAPAAASAPAVQLTATTPGMCVLSRDGLVQGSVVGKFLAERLKQLSAVVQAEVTSDQNSLQADAKTLEGKKATLQPDAYAQQGQALQVRYNQLQQKAQLRDREMQATEQKAVARVFSTASPLVGQIAQQHGCAIVLDGSTVIMENGAHDITNAVIHSLDGALTQFPFDREHLDQGAVAGR